jgi:hypothetical protein
MKQAVTFFALAVIGCGSDVADPVRDDVAPMTSGDPRASGPKEWVGAGTFMKVYETRNESPVRYINDHTFIKAADGTWHMFGITANAGPLGQGPDSGKEDSFAHVVAPALTGPWTPQPDVMHVDPSYFGEDHVWAPHVIESGGTYYMFYAAGVGANAAINLATSTNLSTWTRLPSGPLFRDGLEARDPFVARIGNEWVMYYCASETPAGGRHIVAYRKSSDLIHWGERGIAYTDPTSTSNTIALTESPVVVQHDGKYFLFIGPRGGYVGTDVYRSVDPFHFESSGYAGHFYAHAPEVIEDDGNWWVSAAGWFQYGIELAPLEWRSEPSLWPSAQNPAIDGNHLFTIDADRKTVLHSNGGAWESFGDAAAVAPTIGKNADGRLAVFAASSDGTVMMREQAAGGAWKTWEKFADGAGAAPVIGRNADGRLEAFLLTRAGAGILHRWQLTPNGAWSAWADFGGPAGEIPVVATNADGRLEVFAIAPGGAAITHRYQLVANGDWSGWETFGGPTGGRPAVGRNADGRLEIFVVSSYGHTLARRTQTVASGGWGNWTAFGGWIEGPPAVASNADGRLEVFAIGPGGTYVAHRWQLAPNGGWSAWEPFGGPAPCPASVARRGDGRLEVFLMAPDGHLERRVQAAPSSTWQDWAPFSGVVGGRACWSPN